MRPLVDQSSFHPVVATTTSGLKEREHSQDKAFPLNPDLFGDLRFQRFRPTHVKQISGPICSATA
jgi:hypothetical protein